jgi:hypothetical protein
MQAVMLSGSLRKYWNQREIRMDRPTRPMASGLFLDRNVPASPKSGGRMPMATIFFS